MNVEQETQYHTKDTDDIIGLYLKEAGQTPLLNTEEERHLLRLTADGNEDARIHLVKANTRLVVSVAKKYLDRGVPFLDLIQEGNIGLMHATRKYDLNKLNEKTGEPYKFSTYATWWIRQTVSRSIPSQGRTIRIPVHTGDLITRMYRVAGVLEQEFGRKPTHEEIGAAMQISPDKIEALHSHSYEPLSLDQEYSTNGDGELTLGELLEDNNSPKPEELAIERLRKEQLEKLLSMLSDREAKVLILRFGLNNNRPQTLEEIGNSEGVAREYIRQIELRALRKLKHHVAKSNLERI